MFVATPAVRRWRAPQALRAANAPPPSCRPPAARTRCGHGSANAGPAKTRCAAAPGGNRPSARAAAAPRRRPPPLRRNSPPSARGRRWLALPRRDGRQPAFQRTAVKIFVAVLGRGFLDRALDAHLPLDLAPKE